MFQFKMKSKKGAVLLLMSSLAFLITVFLLANYQLKAEFLGQKQAGLLNIAGKGENALLYIDQMAKLSLAETWGGQYGRVQPYVFSETCRKSVTIFNACASDFKERFKTVFTKNLAVFNQIYNQDFKYEDFNIEITPYGDEDVLEGLDVKGVTDKAIILQEDNIKYKIKPNFRIFRVSVEELDLLK